MKNRFSGCQGLRVGGEWDCKGDFCSDRNVLYPDCGGGYTNIYLCKIHRPTHTHTHTPQSLNAHLKNKIKKCIYVKQQLPFGQSKNRHIKHIRMVA